MPRLRLIAEATVLGHHRRAAVVMPGGPRRAGRLPLLAGYRSGRLSRTRAGTVVTRDR